MTGLFITFEGPDGSGKTTQLNLLEKYLIDKGYDVLITREPGGTKISEQIRSVILDKENTEMDSVTEAMLYASSRAQHVAQLIKPSLKEGKIVISDRFVDSSLVYQGVGRGLGFKFIKKINDFAIQGTMPDITILIKIPPEIGLKRKFHSKEFNRLDMEKIEFHRKVFDAYLQLENSYSDRIVSVDGTKNIDEIHKAILNIIEKRI